MRHLSRLPHRVIALSALLAAAALHAAPTTPTDQPATIRVQVSPQTVESGGRARVTLTLEAAEGIKINRYPKIRFQVAGQRGLVAPAEVTLGNDAPPPLDRAETNYFDEIDPLMLLLDVDRSAPSGEHELEGQLTYYYCVKKSGYCAPKKTPVTIALAVR